jgi:hypothetical protein
MFFFEKKNQKTFPLARRRRCSTPATHATWQKFFASSFQTGRPSFFLMFSANQPIGR